MAQQVPLERKIILSDKISMLVPANITNSGRADGGWMDRTGITAAGMGSLFGPPNALGAIDCFYSNDAWAKEGFCSIQLQLFPPSEVASSEASLTAYLEDRLFRSENDIYRAGTYTTDDANYPRTITDPSSIGSTATMILQKAFTVPITPGPNISVGLTATTIASIIHFKDKGNVLMKANNFERHSPPLDYEKILSSIAYVAGASAYQQGPRLAVPFSHSMLI